MARGLIGLAEGMGEEPGDETAYPDVQYAPLREGANDAELERWLAEARQAYKVAAEVPVRDEQSRPVGALLRPIERPTGTPAPASPGFLQSLGQALRPDYATVGGGMLTSGVGLAANLHNGNVYKSKADNTAASFPRGGNRIAPQATLAWIPGVHDGKETDDFVNGDSVQAYVSVPTPFRANGVLAATHSGDRWALEAGVAPLGLPSGGVVQSHSTKFYTPSSR